MEAIKSIEDLTSALKEWKELEECINDYATSVWLDDKLNSQAQKVLKSAGYHVFPVKVIKDRLTIQLWNDINQFPKDRIPELFELAKKYHEPWYGSPVRKIELIEPGVPFTDVWMRSHGNCMVINFKYGEEYNEYTSAYISKFKPFYKEYLKHFKN